MEITAPKDSIVFEWYDVKFFIRSEFTAYDRFCITVCRNKEIKDGAFIFNAEDFFVLLIKLFVERWEGVTADGKPVPFSLELLKRFPTKKEPKDKLTGDVFLDLGMFIREHVVAPNTEKVEEIKKKSESA
jgi:hypothetical protein